MVDMTHQPPLLSLIIPYYNAQYYIGALIDSIPDDCRLEVVLVNDCSSDETYNFITNRTSNYILTQFKEATTGSRSGVSHCRNIGLDHASGIYMSFLGNLWATGV